MGRPTGKTDYQRRLKAFEMYAAGIKKVEIARELGVTRPAVGAWAAKDRWDERMTTIVTRAEEALNHGEGNEVVATLKTLRGRLATRIAELETMCDKSSPPATRLQAIKMWFTLAGVVRGIPNPAAPTTPKSLELIQDLLHGQAEEGVETPASDYQPLYDPDEDSTPEAADVGASMGSDGVPSDSVSPAMGIYRRDLEEDPDANIIPWPTDGPNPMGGAGGESGPDAAK